MLPFLKDKSLKYKLAMSHISMIIIPLILLGIAEFVWHEINIQYGTPQETRTEDVLKQSIALTSELDSIINSGNPDKLGESNYLQKLNQAVDQRFFYVIVEKGGKIDYVPDRIDKGKLLSSIFDLKSGFTPGHHGYYLLKYRDIQFSDNSAGSIYLLAQDRPKGPGIEWVFFAAVLLGLIINFIISYRVASNIVTPLGILNKATTEIARGNLDHAIEIPSEDEVGELCRSYETMRLQLKEARTLSESYEKNRKELIANISHDLKTPITSIRGYVQGIMEGVASTPEKESKYMQTIYSNAVQMDRLIDELFLFSKLDLKQLVFDFEAVNIEDFLHDCVEDKGYDLENKGINLSFTSTYPSQAPVWADRQRLQRVINNIIVNVEQHQDPNKKQATLEIILSENDDEALIEIKDNGQGINQENLPYIFDRLYRGDPARTRQSKGSGLGLSIAKQIVKAHGGRIWAQSEIEIGTSIFFTLKKTAAEGRAENIKNAGETADENHIDS
ncbi:MAG: HAMP domain-containing sensor histidine kinase [Syntrophomonadaceae bacterium]